LQINLPLIYFGLILLYLILQNKVLSITKSVLEAAIEDYLTKFGSFPETMAIAELGCSSGPNALMAVSKILDAVAERCLEFDRCKSPKFMVFLNDLPGNDFNQVFASLASFHAKLKDEKGADFGPCFIAGMPGSFHGRIVPNNCLHIVHSSSSLRWLSLVRHMWQYNLIWTKPDLNSYDGT